MSTQDSTEVFTSEKILRLISLADEAEALIKHFYPPKESSLWFECLTLPWVIKNFFSHPRMTYQKIGLYCADGRAGGRADVFNVCLIFFGFKYFSNFLRNFVYW